MFLTGVVPSGYPVGIPEAAVTALLGYAVVFFGLFLLMLVVMAMGKIMQGATAKKAAPTPAAAPAAPAAAPGAGEAVVSPLPGTVLDIKVSAGQAVKAGDVLMIIEAMKMENEIPAPKDGTVTAVVVTKGTSVDTGATLVTIA